MSRHSENLTDDIVIQLRKMAKMGNPETHRTYAEKYNVSKSVIGKAIRGDNFAHLNDVEPPFRKVLPRSDRESEVLRLYDENMSQASIAKTLNMSKTTIGILCKQIADRRKLLAKERKSTAITLYLEGDLSSKQIGEKIGVSEKSVNKWIKNVKDKRAKIPSIKRPREIQAPISPSPYEDFYLYYYKLGDKPRVRLIHKDTKKIITMDVIRYRMSIHLNRVLRKDEILIPIDSNGDDSDLSNLKVLTRVEYRESIGIPQFRNCANCDAEFSPRNKTHVFCSEECHVKMMPIIFAGKPKRKKEYTCTCVVCETSFKSSRRSTELCSSKECRSIIAKHGD